MKKSVFFVTNALSGGGAERVMSILSNYLVKRNYQIEFILLNGSEVVYPLDPFVKITVRPDVKDKDTVAQIKYLHKIMKKNSGALFVSFFTHQNLYTILASFGTGIKVLVSERNDPANSFTQKIQKIGEIAPSRDRKPAPAAALPPGDAGTGNPSRQTAISADSQPCIGRTGEPAGRKDRYKPVKFIENR